MLKQGFILRIINQTDRCLKEKIEVIGFMKNELGEKTMKEFLGLKSSTYNYLIDDAIEGKKAKSTKECVINRKLKFEDLNCLGATQLESKINYPEKNKINIHNK